MFYKTTHRKKIRDKWVESYIELDPNKYLLLLIMTMDITNFPSLIVSPIPPTKLRQHFDQHQYQQRVTNYFWKIMHATPLPRTLFLSPIPPQRISLFSQKFMRETEVGSFLSLPVCLYFIRAPLMKIHNCSLENRILRLYYSQSVFQNCD